MMFEKAADTSRTAASDTSILPTLQQISLIFYRVWASLITEVNRTYLSFIWWILDPMLELGLYYIIIGVILKRGGPGFFEELIVGIVIMRWFIATTNTACGQIMNNLSLMYVVKIKKFIFPATTVIANTLKFFLVFIIMFILLISLGIPFTATQLMIPILILIEFVFILGTAMLVSGITPFFPDFDLLYQKFTLMLFWGSGVFFIADELIEGRMLDIFYLNPLACAIDLFRGAILHQTINLQRLTYFSLISVIIFVTGYLFLHYYDKKFPRLVMQK